MGTVNRTVWVDDAGDGISGTIVNNNELQLVYDNIDNEVKSAKFPTLQTKTIIDKVMDTEWMRILNW